MLPALARTSCAPRRRHEQDPCFFCGVIFPCVCAERAARPWRHIAAQRANCRGVAVRQVCDWRCVRSATGSRLQLVADGALRCSATSASSCSLVCCPPCTPCPLITTPLPPHYRSHPIWVPASLPLFPPPPGASKGLALCLPRRSKVHVKVHVCAHIGSRCFMLPLHAAPPPPPAPLSAASGGRNHSACVTKDGSAYAWGLNSHVRRYLPTPACPCAYLPALLMRLCHYRSCQRKACTARAPARALGGGGGRANSHRAAGGCW